MGPSLRPPIFCPLCGSAHQFTHPVGEQNFILGRLRDLQSGYRCPTEDVPLVHTNNPNCEAQPHQGNQVQQQHQITNISVAHLQLLDHVTQFSNYYPRQGYQVDLLRDGSPPDHYDAHPNEERPIQAPVYPHNSPTISEDSTVRLDGHPSLSTPPRKHSRTLSEASMEHIDEFSILPIPPENSPGLSAASMEPLDHFSTLPIPEENPNQDQVPAQDGLSFRAAQAMNQAATLAGRQLLCEFGIFPRPEQYYRSVSMPAEGNVRHYQQIVYGTAPLMMPHRPESLPGTGSDWKAYQLWDEFPPPGSERNGLAADLPMLDAAGHDAEDDNDSVDSDGTVTITMVRNRENDATVRPREEDIPMPSVEGVEDVTMLNVEDIPVPSMENLLRAPPPRTIMRPEPATDRNRF